MYKKINKISKKEKNMCLNWQVTCTNRSKQFAEGGVSKRKFVLVVCGHVEAHEYAVGGRVDSVCD